MREQQHTHTAVIYEFPMSRRVRDRSAAEFAGTPEPRDTVAAVHYETVSCGDCWYHDAAIEQSEPGRKT